MTVEQQVFIDGVYEALKLHAPKYGIKCYSVPIAQAIKESAWGKSDKVYLKGLDNVIIEVRHNYFGLKYRPNRITVSNSYFEEWTTEQETNGTITKQVAQFFRFNSLEECVLGYLQFLNITNYDRLKGVTDAEKYAQALVDCNYATDINYAESLINDYVDKYGLRKYDNLESEETTTMNNGYLIALDDGHGMTTSGKRTPSITELDGRVIHENEFNRAVVGYLDIELKRCGFSTLLVAPTDADTSLSVRVALANTNKADAYVSIHYNAFDGKFDGYDPSGNSIFHYPNAKDSEKLATCIYNYLQQGTPQIKRGVKSENFYVLRETNMTAVLSENGFMDNKEEALLMIDVDFQKEVAREHAQGLCDYFNVPYVAESVSTETEDKVETENVIYRVQVGAFGVKENAENQLQKLKNDGYDGMIVVKTI